MSEVQTAVVLSAAEAIAARIVLLQGRIARDTEELAALDAKLAVAKAQELIGPGYVVEFKAGRKETRRTLTGVVTARGPVKDVDSVRVQVGDGLDAELFTVPVSQLLSAANPDAAPAHAAGALDDLLAEVNG